MREELAHERALFENQLKYMQSTHQSQVKVLEKEIDDNYNAGLKLSYKCIMAVLKKQHPKLKMDE